MSIALEQKIEELEEELQYYRRLHEPPPKELTGHLREKGFWPREVKIMEIFTKQRHASRDLINATLGENFCESYPQVIIHALRKKLAPFGIKIQTIRSYGWKIDETSQERLCALVHSRPPKTSPAPDPLRAAFNRAKLRGL